MASVSPGTGVGTGVAPDPLSKLRIQRASQRPRRSWFKRLVRGLLVLALLAGAGAAGFFWASKNGWISVDQKWVALPEAMQPRLDARLAAFSVETGRSGDAIVKSTGYLESRWQAKIGTRMPGRVQEINVEEGSRVKAGEVLAVLEHADLAASLAAAEATHERAKAALEEQEVVILQTQREYERQERLWKQKLAAESNYDDAKFKYQAAVARRASLIADIALADARRREALQMKENMFIRAPFDGTVVSKDAEVGESMMPGGMGEGSGRGSALTVADLAHLEVECDVNEKDIGKIAPGQTCEVAVDAVPEKRYEGRVRKVIPMGNRARATIKVKVAIVDVDERLFPDMSATVFFLPQQTATAAETPSKRVFCETAAISSDADRSFVWVLDGDDRTRQVDVTTGASRDDRTEIIAGLAGNERVIIAPEGLQPGQRVRVTR